ncbi:MAG: SLC13 family permease [bacterium]
MKKKLIVLLFLSAGIGMLSQYIGMTVHQAVIASVFSCSILGTLFFWDMRLSFVFCGSAILFMNKSITMDEFIRFSSLDVILFLVGMMIIVGMMKETGIFHRLSSSILSIKNISGWKIFVIIMLISAVLSALMGEVTSILVIVTIIFDLCTALSVNPVPLIISSIMATNIGSAATLLGNPIGIFIAIRGGLSFEDFLIGALPLSCIILFLSSLILIIWYRTYIQEISSKIKHINYSATNYESESINFKTKVSLGIFGLTLLGITMHKRLEILFGLQDNTLLIVMPLFFAGIAMAYRHDKARQYVEKEVEWNSLLFFMFLFAEAGVIQASGIAEFIANKFLSTMGARHNLLSGMMLFSSGILSSILDNTVVVAAFTPIIKSLHVAQAELKTLWWCILFGACYGGNITIIGSTANIIALGLLEKEGKAKVYFFEWFKLGIIIGLISMFAAFGAVIAVPLFSR